MVPEFRDGLIVSVSQIKTYLRCPRMYALRYVQGEKPAFVPVPLAFGSAIHAALAFTYVSLERTGAIPKLEGIVQVFKDSWANSSSGPVPVKIDGDDVMTDYIEIGAEMLAAFHGHVASSELPKVADVEKPFLVELRDPATGEIIEERLAGVIDLVVQGDDRDVIVEHKTSAKRYSEEQMQHDLQAAAYLYAGRKLGLKDPAMRYQILLKTKMRSVQVADVTPATTANEDLLVTVVGILRAIEQRIFYPIRGWQCRSCPYAFPCSRM